ncbi:MAG: hypothetical protein KDC98_09890 [Planctomycetes bacterium]|nr:hypothetical protein [Planctomycetota bacterium]
MLRTNFLALLVLSAAACTGGGDGGTVTQAPQTTGAVQVLIDTATGSPALVQVQVVAATLATPAGAMTDNLLATPRLLTLADPTGEVEGLTLANVGSGSYSALHLGLAPGSAVARYPDGTTVDVDLAFDLEIPLADELRHDAGQNSWILCGHDGSPPPAAATATFVWSPRLAGRVSGTDVTLTDVEVVRIEGDAITARLADRSPAPLFLQLDAGTACLDAVGQAYPERAAFLAGTGEGDMLRLDGQLSAAGIVYVRQVRHGARGHGNTGPRLIGRIASLEPRPQTFVMDVFAEARRGGQAQLPLPSQALVFAANASIQRSNGSALGYGDLAVGQLVKVEWLTRTVYPNRIEEVEAGEIEVSPAGGAHNDPHWQGSVRAVDERSRTVTIVPRNGEPIVINGQQQNPVTLHVEVGVPIERHEPGRDGRSAIRLNGIVPGHDRIWFRGVVTGAAAIEASWLRVRDDT